MDIEEFQKKLYEFDALRKDDEIQKDTVNRIEPLSVERWPTGLDTRLQEALLKNPRGIQSPWKHQAEAIEYSLQGNDVVLESPTASGKTLAFTVPMLDVLLNNPGSHALMIYPMKALALDQQEQIREICEPLGIESWPYDGDTAEEYKRYLRQSPPPILLTNPEYLNMSFLGHKNQWKHFLRKLKFVVIDEMHAYRGFFGSNMALLLRRFFLQLKRLGASPRVFLSTATCANPKEHARNLTGRDVKVVPEGNILCPKRHFLFVKPNIPDPHYRKILQLRVEKAALAILATERRALVFCPTKRFLEDAYRKCKQKAKEEGFNPDWLSPFHADLKNDKRQEIQKKIKSGKIRVIFTTNALELGLDIGGLDGVVLAGFPSNIMSAWQQIGRAGRSWNSDAFVLFYAMNDPIDHFFVHNIKAFLGHSFDHLVIDSDNSQLIENHIPSLLAETSAKLQQGDEAILGKPFYDKARKDNRKPIKGYSPQQKLSLRGSIGKSYTLKHNEEKLGQISKVRRFREAYIGAIFPFDGHKYRVHAHEESSIQLKEADSHLRTDAIPFTVLEIKALFEGLSFRDVQIFYGSLTLQMTLNSYTLVNEDTKEEEKKTPEEKPLYQPNRHAVWFDIPGNADNTKGIGALENLLRIGAMFVIPADRFDTSTYSSSKDGLTTYYYENYEGGIGVAKKLYAEWPTALKRGIEIAENCSCRSGCQNCIEPAKSRKNDIDKEAGIALAKYLLDLKDKGPDQKLQNGSMVPFSAVTESKRAQ